MPTLRRILLGLLLATACAGPAFADDGNGESTRFSGFKFEGTARFIDSERMGIALDQDLYIGRGARTPTRQHSRIVYNLRTGRAVVSQDEGTDPKTTTTKRYEVGLPAELSPSQVVNWVTGRDGLERKSIQTLTRAKPSPTFLSKMKSLLFKR